MEIKFKITLIICTYKRPISLSDLLVSLRSQFYRPNEIIIIDGSEDAKTKILISNQSYSNLTYYKVPPEHRGLTKQRNYGVSKIPRDTDIVCFLDDDTILEPDYFEQLTAAYQAYPDAIGVGGYITNEVKWQKSDGNSNPKKFYYKGWMREEPLRFRVRSWFGLAPDTPPCCLPKFSHGRSVSFLPPDSSVHEVEHFMGGVASYKAEVFKHIKFSSFFEGYGLYEDADFCFRLLLLGKLYVTTAARLSHHHEPLGRPNKFKYGQMVVRNGWYIWRVRHPKPGFKNVFKWHLTAFLLMNLSVFGSIKSMNKNFELQEAFGRFVGWWSLLFNKPKKER
jgi:GT2 family glycosyltransferase